MELKFKVDRDSIIKEYLLECGVSKRLGRKIKLYGKIYLNGEEVKNYFGVKKGDEIRVILPDNLYENIKKVSGKLDILYEDSHLLIVNKPYDLAIHPSKKHQDDSLLSRVLGYYAQNNIIANSHILTRLDYATSGIVIICKNAYVNNLLANRKIEKKYLAKVCGELPEEVGKISLPIGRDSTSNIKRKVDKYGKVAITEYRLFSKKQNEVIYELKLITGRTHQIRVHLSYFNLPIIGDRLYGGKEAYRLFLHSYSVKFIHPITNEELFIVCENDW